MLLSLHLNSTLNGTQDFFIHPYTIVCMLHNLGFSSKGLTNSYIFCSICQIAKAHELSFTSSHDK